jgi:hypothetical protein
MAQGTRVSGNLFHENASEDLFVEVNHGPFVVDNNLFLSPASLLDMSQGGAYAHNLFAGRIISTEEPGRQTPYHPPHSTTVAGLSAIQGGDNRYFNNVFVGTGEDQAGAPSSDRHRRASGHGLWVYDTRQYPLLTGGNVFYRGAKPYVQEIEPLVRSEQDPKVRLANERGRFVLHCAFGSQLGQAYTVRVTTDRLGKAEVPGLPYECAHGSPLVVDRDYVGRKRNRTHPTAGPFEKPGASPLALKEW